MILHESRRSPARRIDDLQLLQGLLIQRLYVPEQDRRLLRVLLAETQRQLPPPSRAIRRSARRWRAGGAALALGGALALTFGSPLLPASAASPPPATWVAVADHAADNLAAPADDALLRALMNRTTTSSQAVATADQAAATESDALLRALLNRTTTSIAPADQSDALLRALLNRTGPSSQAVATADQAAATESDVLLRALLNRTGPSSQAIAPAEQMLPQADDALAQVELTVGETLVIPAAQATSAAIIAAPMDNIAQQAVRYYVVQPGDTLSGIALAYYGNGNLWPTIFNANTDKIANPHWIYPNQQLVIPAVANTGYVAQNIPVRTQAAQGASRYTVRSGDTLSGIAAYAYGNGNAWWGIYQANTDKIYNPDLIFPGQVLAIP